MIFKENIRNHRKSAEKVKVPTKLLISQVINAKEHQTWY